LSEWEEEKGGKWHIVVLGDEFAEEKRKFLFNRTSSKCHEGKLDSQNKLTIKIMLLLVMFVYIF
jgi:hypothetical protein